MEDSPNRGLQNGSTLSPFVPPSVCRPEILDGQSYAHYSPRPEAIANDKPNNRTACILGIDEAGRGPVLGPMVYSAFYLPLPLHHPLLAAEYHFDDSKVLTPAVRAHLMQLLCIPGNSLHASCGWAVKVLSARDISAGMLQEGSGNYNLNAQAMDATIELIREIVEKKKINVREVYIDTVGKPDAYQKKLEAVFPALKITVTKKADSLYPCVSAASVCAKVTRDYALEACYEDFCICTGSRDTAPEGWGSGYPSDSKCINWMKSTMHPLFGWGNECRFSWGTSRELLEGKGGELRVDWPVGDNGNAKRVTDFFAVPASDSGEADQLTNWYGQKVTDFF